MNADTVGQEMMEIRQRLQAWADEHGIVWFDSDAQLLEDFNRLMVLADALCAAGIQLIPAAQRAFWRIATDMAENEVPPDVAPDHEGVRV